MGSKHKDKVVTCVIYVPVPVSIKFIAVYTCIIIIKHNIVTGQKCQDMSGYTSRFVKMRIM